MTLIARWLVACAALCAFAAAPARAQQTPVDLFTVSGVRVDQSATNAAQARTQALAQAQRQAFDRLVARLTTAADQARLPAPRPDDPTLDRLVRGVDVEEQPRMSGTRYLGRFAVRFDPAGVTSLLQNAGFAVASDRGSPVLVVPVLAQSQAPGPGVQTGTDPWRQAWEQGGYEREMLPLVVAAAAVVGPADWTTAAAAAGSVGASSAVFAVARQNGGGLTVDLVETGPGGLRVNRAQLTVPIQGGDAGVADAFRRLAEVSSARLQSDYKARPTATAGERHKLQVSALYSDMAEWSKIKEGLGAAGAVISEIRIEAIAKDGAIVSFSHVGAPADLAVALQRYGLSLTSTAIGPTLRVAPH